MLVPYHKTWSMCEDLSVQDPIAVSPLAAIKHMAFSPLPRSRTTRRMKMRLKVTQTNGFTVQCTIEKSYLFGLVKRVRVHHHDCDAIGIRYATVMFWRLLKEPSAGGRG